MLRAFLPAGDLDHADGHLLEALAGVLALALHGAQLARGLELVDRARAGLAPEPVLELDIEPSPIAGIWDYEALTTRETTVLVQLAGGARNKDVAARLCLSPRAVEGNLTAIYGKLQVRGRLQAVARAHELGLVLASGSAPQPPRLVPQASN